MKEEITSRLASLRAQMRADGADAIIIPLTDPHQSEYTATHWKALRHFSGFTGSAGTLVVTAEDALLFTDSRYFIQAASQLSGTTITLMKEGLPGTPSPRQWLADALAPGSTVAVDGMLFSVTDAEDMAGFFAARGITLRTDYDPVAALWTDRPALPQCPVFVHDEKYAGQSAKDKLAMLLDGARENLADSVFISALDEVAWALNIRSRDVRYNPVAYAYLHVAPSGATLLIDPAKLTAEVEAYLQSQGVKARPYADVKSFISSLPAAEKVLIQPQRTSAALAALLGDRAVAGPSVAAMPKACKNATQVQGVRSAMARDGAALVGAVMEIESRIANGVPTSELDVAAILLDHRQRQPLFVDESFGTIAGYGPHGAIVHYEADEQSSSALRPEGLLLIDSGAQYLDGTTDITRTIALGTPTAQEREDFTLVMKGHIALATAIFPAGTCGTQLDALARQYLWKHGLTYLHGTGHGVGHFLNVHEGPQSIRLNYVPAPLTPGMITSNEPGLYREGVHGIRCECLVLCREEMTTEFGQFLGFETLTMFPFDLALFDTSIMTDDEIRWVNDYHAAVRRALAPMLASPQQVEWLEHKTRTLTR